MARKPTEKQLAALRKHAWKPGQSGNPKGRSKTPSFESLVAKVLDEKVGGSDVSRREALARVFVDEMLQRNGAMIREYLARAWPASLKLEHEGEVTTQVAPYPEPFTDDDQVQAATVEAPDRLQ